MELHYRTKAATLIEAVIVQQALSRTLQPVGLPLAPGGPGSCRAHSSAHDDGAVAGHIRRNVIGAPISAARYCNIIHNDTRATAQAQVLSRH